MADETKSGAQVEAANRTNIGEIMTRDVVTVRADFGIEQLVDLFLERGLSRVPVVDDAGHPIGIVSKTDLVVDLHESGDTTVSQSGAEEPGFHVHEVGGIVRDVMTPLALTLPATLSIGEAARRMLAHNVHAVPVVSDDGKVVGMLSATDVVAWVAGVQLGQDHAASVRNIST